MEIRILKAPSSSRVFLPTAAQTRVHDGSAGAPARPGVVARIRHAADVVARTRELAARWEARVVALIGTDPPCTPADREAFAGYADEASARLGQVLLMLAAALAILLWPTDPLFFRDEPRSLHGLALWRPTFVLFAALGYALIGRAAHSGRAARVSGACMVALSAGTLFAFGYFADPDSPWLHNAIVLPGFTILVLIDWPERALWIAVMVVSIMTAYLVPHPEYLRYPHMGSAVGSMFMSSLFNLAAGHLFYRLVRSHFLRGRALERLASTDTLTGLLNRSAFLAAADRELDRAVRYTRPLAVMVLDVDRFKRVNDTDGHAAGDQLLAGLAAALQSVLRRSDLAGRVGGDEFAIVLPESDLAAAQDVAERIRSSLAAGPAASAPTTGDGEPTSRPRSCTVSIGIASRTEADRDVASLVRRADAALYAAKRGGRDRVSVAQPGRSSFVQ